MGLAACRLCDDKIGETRVALEETALNNELCIDGEDLREHATEKMWKPRLKENEKLSARQKGCGRSGDETYRQDRER